MTTVSVSPQHAFTQLNYLNRCPMRSLVLCSVLFCALLLAFGRAPTQAGTLEDADALIAARQYDKAIEVLEKAVAAGKANAEIYNKLGIAYNWKKDFDNALKNYRSAAKLDKKYLTSALPILDGFKLYDEIIQVGEAAVASGDKSPAVLTALLNAYFETKNVQEYQRVLNLVKAQQYSRPYDANYRLYILAKAEVRADRHDSAIAYIAQMNDRSLLQYMRTAEDFKPISNDPRFRKLTE